MELKNAKQWTADELLEMGRSYQPAAVFAAAADLDLFPLLARAPASAEEAAQALACDLRGLTLLLDALTALRLLEKWGDRYALAAGMETFLTHEGPKSILAMAQHQANCLRNWAQLAWVVKHGKPAACTPSIRGDASDTEAFIGAMHNICAPIAEEVIHAIHPLRFTHLLDVGGASGTWTAAFLKSCPAATATLFDLPEVIPLAQKRLATAGLDSRVTFAAGDFLRDPLPEGTDFAWVSAIVHQNSRAQNRALFASVFRALKPGGQVVIRDVLMEPARTRPAAGALFAINMLVATEGGGTFTFEELKEDLESAGFVHPNVLRRDQAMNSLVGAAKPA